MGLIKESKQIDLSTKSEPWTDEELVDFRIIMQQIKSKNKKYKERLLVTRKSKEQLPSKAKTSKTVIT